MLAFYIKLREGSFFKIKKLKPPLRICFLGNIITAITKDVIQFEATIGLFNNLWIAVIQTVVICYLMYVRIGIASLVGITITLLAIPIQGKR